MKKLAPLLLIAFLAACGGGERGESATAIKVDRILFAKTEGIVMDAAFRQEKGGGMMSAVTDPIAGIWPFSKFMERSGPGGATHSFQIETEDGAVFNFYRTADDPAALNFRDTFELGDRVGVAHDPQPGKDGRYLYTSVEVFGDEDTAVDRAVGSAVDSAGATEDAAAKEAMQEGDDDADLAVTGEAADDEAEMADEEEDPVDTMDE